MEQNHITDSPKRLRFNPEVKEKYYTKIKEYSPLESNEDKSISDNEHDWKDDEDNQKLKLRKVESSSGSPEAPIKSSLKKYLCPHRHHGCLYEATSSPSISRHQKSECVFEKIKDYLHQKEAQLSELQMQVKQNVKETESKLQNMQHQISTINCQTTDLIRKVYQTDQPTDDPAVIIPILPALISTSSTSNIFSNSSNLVVAANSPTASILNNKHNTSYNTLINGSPMLTSSYNKLNTMSNQNNNNNNNNNNQDMCGSPTITQGYKYKQGGGISPLVAPKDANPVSAKLKGTLEGHQQIVTSITSNDKYIFSGSGDNTLMGSLRVWDIDNFNLLQSLDDTGVVYSLLTQDGRLFSGHLHIIKIWDILSSSRPTCIFTLEGHKGEVKALKIVGRNLYSAAVDKLIKVWCLEKMTCTNTISGHLQQVVCLEPCLGKNQELEYLISGSHDKTIKVWDNKYQLVCTLSGHRGEVRDLAMINSVLLSASDDGTIRMWDWKAGVEIYVIEGIPPVSVLLSGRANGEEIFFSGHSNGSIMIWNFNSKQCVQVISAHRERVRILYGTKKMLVSGSYDKSIKLWG